MNNLEPNPLWASVRQLEEGEYATGGPDGNINEQAKALTARTEFLKQRILYNYKTLDEANADIANISVHQSVDVVDSGLYYKATVDDTSLTKDPNDSLTQSQKYTNSVLADGYIKNYATETLLKASKPTVSEMRARADDTRKIWRWTRTSAEGVTPVTGTWTDTGLSDLDRSKKYTDTTIVETVALKKANDSSIINIVNDSLGNSMLWIDKATGIFNASGLKFSMFNPINQLKPYASNDVIAGATDKNGNVLWGVDKATGKFFAAGLDTSSKASSTKQKNYKYFAQKPLSLEINHVLSYGQSLSMGATATTLLSTTQPYFNLTFNTGPRKDTEATSVIPLVEQFNNPSIDGYANRGETHCSGLANYASRAMMLENGINPQDHVIFASTAGHGGYTIDQLKKGSAWYSVLIDHVNKAKSLNVGKSYHVPVVPWIQGENNAASGGIQTPYAEYKAKLTQLQIDANTDIKAITAQIDPVRFITYQMSYAARTWPEIAKAQLDLARENDNFMLATPMYHFPYAGDNVHLTNVGYKWMGAYFARAYKQYMIEGRKPDFINPLSAYIKGNQIIVKFDVPTLPLKIDTTTLAITTNAGFKVMTGSSEIAITSVTASDDTVILQLASTPTNSVQVRYALDYLGLGLTVTGGASGNLRDSTQDSVEIAGAIKPLYHVCPHFEITAFLDKGV